MALSDTMLNHTNTTEQTSTSRPLSANPGEHHRLSDRRVHSMPSSSSSLRHHRNRSSGSTLDRSNRDKDDPYFLAMPETPSRSASTRTVVSSASNPNTLGYIEPRLERASTVRPLTRSASAASTRSLKASSVPTIPIFERSSPRDTLPQSPESFFVAVFGNNCNNDATHISSPSSSSISSTDEDEDRKFRPTSLTSLSSISSVSSSEQQQSAKSFPLNSAQSLRRLSLLQSSNGSLLTAPLSLKAARRQSVSDIETLVCVVIESEFTKYA